MKKSSLRFIALLCGGIMVLSSCHQSDKKTTAEDRQDGQIENFYDTSRSGASPSETEKTATAAEGKDKGGITRYELPAPLKDRPEQIIRRKGYTVSYNKETRTANWVAWHLTKGHTYGRNQRSAEQFSEDATVGQPRATDWDYYNSRYDRGHMCPAGDNKWDAQAMRETFLFTNICPQNHALNKYEWNDVEMMCREWARQLGAIDIVCGPVYTKGKEVKTIGKNKVRVPDGFFKVILDRDGNGKAIGFLYDNNGKKVNMRDAVRTVDDIERLTGIDFFPALDDKKETRVEATADLNAWPHFQIKR